jgi:hypothetical protein
MSQKNKTKEHLFKLEAAKGQKRKNTHKKKKKLYFGGVLGVPTRVRSSGSLGILPHGPATRPCQRTTKVPAIENLTVGLYNII